MTIVGRAAQKDRAEQLVAQKDQEQARLAQIGSQVLNEQKKAKQVQQLDEAHTMGIDDGLAAMQRKQSFFAPGATISNEEVARAREMFGPDANAQDVQRMRELDSLEKVNGGSIGAPAEGLAQQIGRGY